MELYQQIILYILLLIGLYIYVKTSKITINNKPIIPAKYRISLAVLFPLIIILAIIFSTFIIALALAIVIIIGLLILFQKIKRKI